MDRKARHSLSIITPTNYERNTAYKSLVTNITTVLTFHVVSDKFNAYKVLKEITSSHKQNSNSSGNSNSNGCETWSLTLREEHRLRVFENRVLRRIFGPKRDKVTGGWKKTA
jgi:hypothetical protein